MSTAAAASKLLRYSNLPLRSFLRPAANSTTIVAATQLFKTNPQYPEEFKLNGINGPTVILQPNWQMMQSPFGFTAAGDKSKVKTGGHEYSDEFDEDDEFDSGDEFDEDEDEDGDEGDDDIDIDNLDRPYIKQPSDWKCNY